MERREKRHTDAYKAKKRAYNKQRKKKQRKKGMDDRRKLENLTQHFYSSPYPQRTAAEIEELETAEQVSNRQDRRRVEKRILRKERQLAAKAYKLVVSEYNSRLQADEKSRRGWMEEHHQSRSLKMRNLDLNEIKRDYDFQRKHADLLKTRSKEMKKEDNKAARTK